MKPLLAILALLALTGLGACAGAYVAGDGGGSLSAPHTNLSVSAPPRS